MPTLLTKSLAASVVAGLCFVAAPQARAINSFTLSGAPGTVSLNPPNNVIPGTAPNSIDATFLSPFSFADLDGDFTGLTAAEIQELLTFTLVDPNFPNSYSLPAFNITFNGAGNGITSLAVAGPSTYTRMGNSAGSMLISNVDLMAVDNNGLAYTGYFSIISSLNNNGLFTLKFTAVVPEPLTMLGASAAIAFGAAFKRRQVSKG